MRTKKKTLGKRWIRTTLMVAVSLAVILFVVSAVSPAAAQSTGNETVQRIAFDYGDFGGNLNLEVNGDRVFDIGSFAQSPPNGVDGSTIGGASVSVQTTSGTSGEVGHVEITGTDISSFSVGGQELFIDNVEFGPASNPSADVTFDNPTPSQPQYALGDRFTDSGVDINVTPFIFADGTSCTAQSICGFGEQDSSTPAQSGGNAPDFRPNNVNLDFDISSFVTSVDASGDTATPGGQATVDVSAQNFGAVEVSNIPSSWSVASSQNDGAFIAPDGNGDDINSGGNVAWVWTADQSSANVSVTLNIPSDAQTRDFNLDVEEERGNTGETATDTATVTVQDCPFEPVVCSFDPNGDIDTGDLQQAIDEFIQGNINTAELQAVINAFLAS